MRKSSEHPSNEHIKTEYFECSPDGTFPKIYHIRFTLADEN